MQSKGVRKVVKIGNSLAVTIPALDARLMKIKAGHKVYVAIQPIEQDR